MLRTITRAHVIAWRKDLEKRELATSSIRRKLAAREGGQFRERLASSVVTVRYPPQACLLAL